MSCEKCTNVYSAAILLFSALSWHFPRSRNFGFCGYTAGNAATHVEGDWSQNCKLHTFTHTSPPRIWQKTPDYKGLWWIADISEGCRQVITNKRSCKCSQRFIFLLLLRLWTSFILSTRTSTEVKSFIHADRVNVSGSGSKTHPKDRKCDVERGLGAAEVNADHTGCNSCLSELCCGFKQTVAHVYTHTHRLVFVRWSSAEGVFVVWQGSETHTLTVYVTLTGLMWSRVHWPWHTPVSL